MCSVLGTSRMQQQKDSPPINGTPPREEEEEEASPRSATPSSEKNERLKDSESGVDPLECSNPEESEEEEDDEEEDDRPLDFTAKRENEEESYFLPFKKLEMNDGGNEPPPTKKKKRMGFSIDDILSHRTAAVLREQQDQAAAAAAAQHSIVRPWDNPSAAPPRSESRRKSQGDSPLDALFQMTSKTFEGLKAKSELDHAQLSFTNKQPPKKKRKSRTAFTNHQIFELEKRFLYQKYLSPADRDEIAASLGLTNAQVITWFQNRRAKLKRDMEELRKDVECTSHMIPHHGNPAQMAAAVAALAASRGQLPHHNAVSPAAAAAAAAAAKYSLSPTPPHHMTQRSPLSDGDRSPQIRVTDSDG